MKVCGESPKLVKIGVVCGGGLTLYEDVIYFNSYNKTNEMYEFLKFIFGIELYMFRTDFLSIIRSLVLYTQQ